MIYVALLSLAGIAGGIQAMDAATTTRTTYGPEMEICGALLILISFVALFGSATIAAIQVVP